MEIHQPNENDRGRPLPEEPTRPEVRVNNVPRIYVASLADYNNGILHGAWLDADGALEDIDSAIQVILDKSPTGDAEEFAIFDFEGFEAWRPHEYESIAMVSTVAQGIAEHGPAFAHWVEVVEAKDPESLVGFEDAYLGHWESLIDYAENLIDDAGIVNQEEISHGFYDYISIDYISFARDLQMSGEVVVSRDENGVHLFEGNR